MTRDIISTAGGMVAPQGGLTVTCDKDTKVFACTPTAGGIFEGPDLGLWLKSHSAKFNTLTTRGRLSELCSNFQRLWDHGLHLRDTQGVTHFAMLHADVDPAGQWCEQLHAQLVANNLQLVSAVVPIKTEAGLTSTALGFRDSVDLTAKRLYKDYLYRRLTMHEAYQLPETFTHKDVCRLFGEPEEGTQLWVNTGCWMADLRTEWADEVFFDVIHGRPKSYKDGAAFFFPEDWHLSYQLAEWGVPYGATRAVPVDHLMTVPAGNARPWGTMQRDEDYFRKKGVA